jgi:hypothetical protein
VLDLIVILLQVGVPSSGPSVEVMWQFPILKVGMIGKDGEWFFGLS